jgi:hypothetical protein
MPQPESSRNRALEGAWYEPSRPWPVDPAAPRRFGARLGHTAAERPKPEPEKDGRTPDDKDGNEELEREVKEKPPTRQTSSAGEALPAARAWRDMETEDSGEWVATERFTLEDELEDTWPNVPSRYLDD